MTDEAALITDETKPVTEKETLFAHLSAITLEALAPMMREVDKDKWSEVAFFSQTDTRFWGTYIIPADKGVIVLVVDGNRMLAVHDEEGHASGVLKVYFPDDLLDKAMRRLVELHDENGSPFMAVCEPRPGIVHCTEGFALLFVESDEEALAKLKAVQDALEVDSTATKPLKKLRKYLREGKYPGCFGSWFNQDHGNHKRMDSWRLEHADIEFAYKLLELVREAQAEPVREIDLDLTKLSAMSHAAKTLGTAINIKVNGAAQAIEIYSTPDQALFGVLMPCKGQRDFDMTGHFVSAALLPKAVRDETEATNVKG